MTSNLRLRSRRKMFGLVDQHVLSTGTFWNREQVQVVARVLLRFAVAVAVAVAMNFLSLLA